MLCLFRTAEPQKWTSAKRKDHPAGAHGALGEAQLLQLELRDQRDELRRDLGRLTPRATHNPEHHL